MRKLQFTPRRTPSHHHHLTVVGPTPQRDGKVLGLFDLLEDTPQKDDHAVDTPNGSTDHLQKTPSKPAAAGTAMDSEFVTPLKHSRTPASSSRRFFLDMFVTPSKKRDAALLEEGGEGVGTGTPSFLRRRQPGRKTDESPFRVKKPPGKTLSALIADLRKLENQKADDELDVLRELEEEAQAGVGVTKTQLNSAVSGNNKSKDEPPTQMPKRDGVNVDEATPDNPPPTGPKKVWKKRGQKRTTKRVISKSIHHLFLLLPIVHPVFSPPPVFIQSLSTSHQTIFQRVCTRLYMDASTNLDIVRPSLKSITNPASHPSIKNTPFDDPSFDAVNNDELNDSTKENHPSNSHNDDGNENENDPNKHQTQKKKTKTTKKKGVNGNATSHANFRRLKLRNKNSKGGKAAGYGGGRKFGGRGGRR